MDMLHTVDHLTAENAKLRAEVEKMTGVFEKWRRCAEIGACDRCERAENECNKLRERLQFDPGGSDKIDELEQALQFVRHDVEVNTAEVERLKKEIWSLKKYQWAFRQIAARLDRDGGQAQTGNPDADLERIDKAACEWLSSFEESKELKAENERLRNENVNLREKAACVVHLLSTKLDGLW